MAETFSMEEFRAQLNEAAADANVDDATKSWCDNVVSKCAMFLAGNSLASDSMAGLESLWKGNIPQLNHDRDVVGNVDKGALLNLLTDLKVPASMKMATAVECMRQLGGGVDRTAVLEVAQPKGDLGAIIGQRGMNTLNHDVMIAGTEAFGVDSNNYAQDNRLSFVLTILRTNTSVVDKVLPRVAENSNYIVIKTDMGEVYDLDRSMAKDSATRNSALTRRPLVELFKAPDMVNSQPQQVVPDTDNDTDTVKKLYASVNTSWTDTTALVPGVTANLWDLVYDENTLGYSATDYSDLLAEGGKLAYVLVSATKGTGSSAVTEVFKVPTKYLPTAKFSQTNTNIDVQEVAVNLKTDYTLRAGRLEADGVTTSTIFADFTKALVQIDINFSVMLNLQTGGITGSGSVEGKLVAAAGQTTIDATAQTDFNDMTFAIVAYSPELFFDEENLRKTNIAVRVKTKQTEFTIPNGRNYVFDLALQQETDQSTLSMVSTVSSLGNSIRGLTIIESTLNEVADQLEFLQANPEMASLVEPRNMSIASSVVIPSVVRGNLNLNDGNTYVMRESERLSEGHARLRQTILYGLAEVCAQSLYLNQLNAGETPVFKVITHTLIKDLLFGLKDYHAALDDKVTTAAGADLSLVLPNGFRLDIAATNFVNLEDTILVFPVRQSDPTGVTSFGTIRDRGNYTAQYNPINNQGVTRRVVQNTREIVMPTNPIGGIFTISGLQEFLGTIEALFAPVASSSASTTN